ncbi:hypothetical protein BN1048_02245 [Jeotgalicoccus saudimassiliensis]|uniref:Cxxc_20_cxxc protein n=1 Tax=Jeotgalicoccus saudimassiliensis TaxID=1461582 RepID=A0A078MC84_9STAP|nr:TIGR04104 family putative zinc finger protein [Jeotgalicoccus saudimassiliensis]CEA03890.1 hypothetical protein BN1048_02245 [Jeotgalicoccus saudimassiliensis]
MTSCTKCQTEWSFKNKAVTLKRITGELKCPYCGEEQFLSKKAQLQMGVSNMIIPATMLLPLPFDIPLPIHLPIILLGIAAVIILNIGLVKLSDKREYPV